MSAAYQDNLGGGFKVTPRARGRVQAIRNSVIVEEMKFGMRTTGKGLILLSDDGMDHGIVPRWARVYSVGPDQEDIKVGQYVLVSHGRWTRGIEVTDPDTEQTTTIRRVDVNDILMVSDTLVEDETIGNL